MPQPEALDLLTYRLDQLEGKLIGVLSRVEGDTNQINDKINRILSEMPVDKYKVAQIEIALERVTETLDHLKGEVSQIKAKENSKENTSITQKYAPPVITAATLTAVAEALKLLIQTLK